MHEKLMIWFFRDVSEEQRQSLFRLHGAGTDVSRDDNGRQTDAFKCILRGDPILRKEKLPLPSEKPDAYELGYMNGSKMRNPYPKKSDDWFRWNAGREDCYFKRGESRFINKVVDDD